MTPSTSASKRGANPHYNGETPAECEKKSLRVNSNSTSPALKPTPIYPDAIPFTLQDDVDHKKQRISVEKNIVLALEGQTYASTEFKPSTPSPTKKKGKKKKEKTNTTLSALGPIPPQIDVMVKKLYKVNNGVTAGVLGLLNRNEISDQLKDYDMKNKWENFESLLRNVHGETGGGDTKQRLYGHNVVNYVTIKNTSEELLPLHSPSVFHYVLHYNDMVSNFYNIHFDFENNNVTLSPSQLGNRKIYVALFTKLVDQGKKLGANVIGSFDTACNLLISKELCAPMIEDNVDQDHSLFDWLFDNDCKVLWLKVLTVHHNGIHTLFKYVRFEEQPGQLVKGQVELTGTGREHTNEVTKQIFMEHIPYVFREIFVIDPEVLKIHSWVEALIKYSYLPKMGKIFTPLTEALEGHLVEKLDDLLLAKLAVIFLSRSDVRELDDHLDVAGGDVFLTDAFNYLEGSDFEFHKFSGFETWDCFKETKGDLKKFKESEKFENEDVTEYLVGWVMFIYNTEEHLCWGNNLNQSRNEGDNSDRDNVDNESNGVNGWNPGANNSNESGKNVNNLKGSGNTAKTVGETMNGGDSTGGNNSNQSENKGDNSDTNKGNKGLEDGGCLNTGANNPNESGNNLDNSNGSG
eukprot:jgi/Psemu1/42429/gm1.42429_g